MQIILNFLCLNVLFFFFFWTFYDFSRCKPKPQDISNRNSDAKQRNSLSMSRTTSARNENFYDVYESSYDHQLDDLDREHQRTISIRNGTERKRLHRICTCCNICFAYLTKFYKPLNVICLPFRPLRGTTIHIQLWRTGQHK